MNSDACTATKDTLNQEPTNQDQSDHQLALNTQELLTVTTSTKPPPQPTVVLDVNQNTPSQTPETPVFHTPLTKTVTNYNQEMPLAETAGQPTTGIPQNANWPLRSSLLD